MIVVAAALIDDEGRVLLQQRSPGREMAGLWEFPGGKIEPGERPETALARELAEELGIDVEEGALTAATFASAALGPGTDGSERHLLLLLYCCRRWRGVPQALDAAALTWVRPEEMLELAMPPADAPLIPILDALLDL